MAPDNDLRQRAQRALRQRLELERGLGADVLPRRRVTPAEAPSRAAVMSGGGRGTGGAGNASPTAPARVLPAGSRGGGPVRGPASPALRIADSPRVSRPAPPRDPVLDLPEDVREKFIALRGQALACTKCGLCKTRTQVVFGVGSPRAPLMFVGEAPGADEDRLGEPFVGKAGQLLTRVLAELGVRRDDVYIANVLKCRPPDNRKPEPEEVAQCFPYLRRQIDLIRPKLLCALGAVAAAALLGTVVPITRIRGRFQDFPWMPGLRVFPTFHPAYLLRSPWEMPKFKEDLKRALSEVGLLKRS